MRCLIFIGFVLLAPVSMADARTELIASHCLSCHGHPSHQGIPNLKSQSPQALYQTLKDFQSGKRPATIMHHISRGLSDEDILNLAEYLYP